MMARLLRRVTLLMGAVLFTFAAAEGALAQGMDKGMMPKGMDKGQMPMMGGMQASDAPHIPPVAGYLDGQSIYFLHTEASDAKIAKMLTDMMGSPVLEVPALARAPGEMLATVYVFANGVKPDGPHGPLDFQPDVFDNPPGSPAYSPLRKIVLVNWKNGGSARVLKSVQEVQEAITSGAVAVEEPGVVVNMPLVTWPGGRR